MVGKTIKVDSKMYYEFPRVLTHRTIIHRAKTYFAKYGWQTVVNKKGLLVRVDGIFRHKLADFGLAIKVNPSLTDNDEVCKGLGQVIQFLPDKAMRTVLIVPMKFLTQVKPIFDMLNERIGLLIYDSNLDFEAVKDVWSVPDDISNRTHLAKILEAQVKLKLETNPELTCIYCGYKWIVRKRRKPDIFRRCPRCQRSARRSVYEA